ncbi:MAG TPA: ATP-binding protein [Usitatibacter sp.]|nr:ATP-binding protein [Usitatibacter sp.]
MNATTTPLPATAVPMRKTIALVGFGIVYYALAAYAASLPLHQRVPLFIWPAHGLALGTLLVVAPRQWPAFLALIVAATLGVGFTSSAPWSATIVTAIVNAAQPLLVAAGLQRLAGPRVQIDTVKGLASFLIGMLPLVAAISILDASYSYLRFDAPFRERWSVTFVSTLLGMLVLSPLLLAWSRPGYEDAMDEARARMPELVVLYLGLMFTTAWVFSTRPQGGGFVPPLAYLCAPFLIWAALRFGLRAATMGLAMFGLIAYWYTGTGITNFAVPGGAPDIKALLNLQAFLATIVITTLFSAALHVEREEATRETQAWRHRHERVIRASASLLYEFDPIGGQVVWDGDTRSVLGTSADQVATVRQWMARVHPDDRPRLKGLRQQLVAGEISHITIEYRFQRDDSEYITVGVNAYLVGDPSMGKEGRKVIGFVKDVSEKVRAEEERLRLEAQLKQAEKMQAVGHLAGGIAHDFNNILGAILGYGELAQAKAKDGDVRRYLDTIMDAGNRAKALVTQILSYSRAEGAEKIPVIVGPIAQEVCDLVRGSSPLSIEVTCRIDDAEAAVLGDPTRLHQLLMNLSTNAVHAMDGGGKLDIWISREEIREPRQVRTGEIPPGEYVVVAVKDSGHGIAPEVIDRIFEPFFTTKPAGRGTGLGLALVHSVVVEHKGYLEVKSELGQGTQFTVWMPQIRAEIGPVEVRRDELPRGEGQQVLVVDDEPEVLAALEEMLATLGYEPSGYRNGREALDAVRADPKRFEAVVSDEVMPELTGTQLAIELRRINPTLPILIASGYGGSGFEARALAAGVNRVIKKPYRMSEIAEILSGFFTLA